MPISHLEILHANNNPMSVYSVSQLTERIEKLPNITNNGHVISLSRRESYLNILKAADISLDSEIRV